jgi:hypothetical protein
MKNEIQLAVKALISSIKAAPTQVLYIDTVLEIIEFQQEQIERLERELGSFAIRQENIRRAGLVRG